MGQDGAAHVRAERGVPARPATERRLPALTLAVRPAVPLRPPGDRPMTASDAAEAPAGAAAPTRPGSAKPAPTQEAHNDPAPSRTGGVADVTALPPSDRPLRRTVAEAGYVEEEHLVRGTADLYGHDGEGRTVVVATEIPF